LFLYQLFYSVNMVVFNKIATILVGLALAVSAVPTTLPRLFTVHQVARPMNKRANGAAAYARAIGKFGGHVPQHVLDAAWGSVVTTPSAFDTEYDTPVTVGNSTLRMDLDTGSSDL
jgi:aspergillopepsin I